MVVQSKEAPNAQAWRSIPTLSAAALWVLGCVGTAPVPRCTSDADCNRDLQCDLESGLCVTFVTWATSPSSKGTPESTVSPSTSGLGWIPIDSSRSSASSASSTATSTVNSAGTSEAHSGGTSQGSSLALPSTSSAAVNNPGSSAVATSQAMPLLWPVTPDHPTQYTVGGDTVMDLITGLMWQRMASPLAYTWQGASQACDGLDLGGFGDWRLPTRVELVSLVDYTRSDPAINLDVFPGTPASCFWSSSSNPDGAWTVEYGHGLVAAYAPGAGTGARTYLARCVRAAGPTVPVPPDRYSTEPTGVLDLWTGLTWQLDASSVRYSWSAAAASCQGRWRLPSIKELLTLVDDALLRPAIDPVAFPHTPPEAFWSASPFAANTYNSWYAHFGQSYISSAGVAVTYRARCVR